MHKDRGPKIDGVEWHYDHAIKRQVRGHQLVTSLLTIKGNRFPLAFRRYRRRQEGMKDFRTKLDLALALIKEAVAEGWPFSVVGFDSWYFSKPFVLEIEALGKDWVGGCKANRVVIINQQRAVLGEYLSSLPKESYQPIEVDGKTYYCHHKVYTLQQRLRVKVVAYHETEDLSQQSAGSSGFTGIDGRLRPSMRILSSIWG